MPNTRKFYYKPQVTISLTKISLISHIFNLLIVPSHCAFVFVSISKTHCFRRVSTTPPLPTHDMSHLKAWVFEVLFDYLSKPPGESSSKRSKQKRVKAQNKIFLVQVIDVNTELKVLTINDSVHSVPVFLTKRCLEALHEENMQLDDLNHSFIKIDDWCFSTVIHCGGSGNIGMFPRLNIKSPVVIQCNKVVPMGGGDGVTIGKPININLNDKLAKLYQGDLPFKEITERLGRRQFPDMPPWNRLPDAEGEFCIPAPYSDETPLLLSHCVISADQVKNISHIAITRKNASDLIH